MFARQEDISKPENTITEDGIQTREYGKPVILQQPVAKLSKAHGAGKLPQAVAKLAPREVAEKLQQTVAKIPWGHNVGVLY